MPSETQREGESGRRESDRERERKRKRDGREGPREMDDCKLASHFLLFKRLGFVCHKRAETSFVSSFFVLYIVAVPQKYLQTSYDYLTRSVALLKE